MIRILVDIHYQDSKKRPCFRRSLTFFEDGDTELALNHVQRHANSPKIVWEYHDGPVPPTAKCADQARLAMRGNTYV